MRVFNGKLPYPIYPFGIIDEYILSLHSPGQEKHVAWEYGAKIHTSDLGLYFCLISLMT